jgi:hypothetical protein
MLQGNSLFSYLRQINMSFFSFSKAENRREKQVLSGEDGTSGERVCRKGYRKVNMVQILNVVEILCTHVCKCKNEAC